MSCSCTKENHEAGIARRPLSGTKRAEIPKEAETLGPLNAYEQNIHKADEDLLKAGNFSYVPTMDVIKTAIKEYKKQYQFDEDIFKEIKILRYSMFTSDTHSKILIVVNTILHIYGDPTVVRTDDCIQQLITVQDILQLDIDKCLNDENVMKDNDDIRRT
ncbi:unnamed protein product [Didymodactylos carnosus]|uniref:Uncharacterized protein n=1 Tax=Didymodactylos carnosus TaxID=1234261 RepID=A0A815JZM6_9BILA|nr:unnamed protein product [Didymodactylos carnosus]CAF1386580.1 unnamed protein product [Didymodactylos carnosus]CAF3625511.1 unnamed protein product [Didymodactylos carnosus]CAF4281492.1 unnamed protein product [Didymodactylos carnosus]